jgi:hypothetical protein
VQGHQQLFCTDLRALRFAFFQDVALAQLDDNLSANRRRGDFARRSRRDYPQAQLEEFLARISTPSWSWAGGKPENWMFSIYRRY